MKFTTIDNIVRDLCAVQLNVPAESGHYLRVLRAVRSAVEQVNLTYLPTVKSVLTEVNTQLVAPLPQDVVTVLKVGMITSNGKLTQLIQNPKIRREVYNDMTEDGPEFCDCEQPPSGVIEVSTSSTPVSTFRSVLWPGQFYGELYASSNAMDQEGGWRWNEGSNVLEMATGSLVKAGVKILVEYKGSGDEQYQVIPSAAQTTIEFFALYKLFSNDPGRSSYFMNEFRRNATQLKHDLAPFDLLAVTNAFLRGQKATVK